MKKLTLATLTTLACSSVFAVDGTIRVNGVVTDQTCTLEAGGGPITGLKNLTVNLPAISKSTFHANLQGAIKQNVVLRLLNATGTDNCDAATAKAFKGIHLSVASPDEDLDDTDKTLLVNKSTNAPTINPVFIRIYAYAGSVVDLSEPWGTQEKSPIITTFGDQIYLQYVVSLASKTGIVDAQNVHAVVNYTMHYN